MRRRLLQPGAHPRTRDRLRSTFVRHSLTTIVCGFLLVLALIGTALGLLLSVSASGGALSTGTWIRSGLLTLLGQAPDEVTRADLPLLSDAAVVLAIAAAVIGPALLFGAVVFKLLVNTDVLEFRRSISVLPTPPDHDLLRPNRQYLAIRFYSASQLPLVDVEADVLLQHYRRSGAASVVRRSRPVEAVNPRARMLEQHLPYTLQIELRDGDFDEASGTLRRLHAVELGDRDRLLILMRGTIPSLGSDFAETHAYDLASAVVEGPFAPVDVNPSQRSDLWRGWAEFDD